MTADDLAASLAVRGVRLAVDAGQLVVDAPRGELSAGEMAVIRGAKADLIALLRGPPSPTGAPFDFAVRWGPGLEDDAPPIAIPRTWRDEVAGWPRSRWREWRRRSGELQPPDPTAEEIRESDRRAYEELASAPARAEPEDALVAAVLRLGFVEVDAEVEGIPPAPPPEAPAGRYRCLSACCLHKRGWWMSAWGVVNCLNCRPPAFPHLAVAQGDESDAPEVDPIRSNQAIGVELPR